AVALAKRVARILYACLERVAKEVILPGKSADRLSNPKAECALECAAEQGFAMVNSFYASVVQGSLGTSAMYQAVYQLRRTNRDASDDWSEVHEELLQSYARAVDDANRAIEHDVR